MNKIIIIIPIFKINLTDFEIISVKRAINILSGQQEIIFIHPKSLELSNYYLNFPEIILYKNFDDFYFSSITGYNNLLLSSFFYENFLNYDYMLIYQTDCYIFENNLTFWADKEYDYIGGVWFENFTSNPYDGAKMSYPGNGGFSLRKVKSCYDLITSNSRIKSCKDILAEYKAKKKQINYLIIFFKILIKYFSKKNIYKYCAKRYRNNEDVFFMEEGRFLKTFSIPDVNEAINFSWDRCPKYLLDINKKLPMGCHAWYRNDFPYEGNLNFWKTIINSNQKN